MGKINSREQFISGVLKDFSELDDFIGDNLTFISGLFFILIRQTGSRVCSSSRARLPLYCILQDFYNSPFPFFHGVSLFERVIFR